MTPKKTLVELENMPQIQLIDAIIGKMEDNKLSEASIKTAKPYIKRLSKKLDISDDAAMIFSAFFNDFRILELIFPTLLVSLVAIK
jgi:hypothetical protein